ncbi:MAG: Cellulosome-anchoring protein precursor [Pelotomaculum sp. PtaB.Bin013]|uniref:Ig-like domain-containing protein n=1 Tax=Pelotomaculum isophthalicicum JI TaxID=947010 RepID=A0A9X4JTN2_9FIRM|nr:Ig-like domain-containing protein [Pelotomaculum isophthalicicum]MDF9409024.1 Ig-like domain-containing protein [Pelotomaculum isophthalicicum JI]OPX91357.1 MAG: Cellulosome-anchoring protein precursor [Pelotomaculum sp. PtaB.Bin013]
MFGRKSKTLRILLSVFFIISMLLSYGPAANAIESTVVTVGTVTGEPGTELQVPVYLTSTGNVAVGQFDMYYDSALLTYTGYDRGDLVVSTSHTFIVTNPGTGPKRTRVIISSNPKVGIPAGTGTLIILKYQVAAGAQPGQSCALQLINNPPTSTLKLNDVSNAVISATWQDGQFSVPALPDITISGVPASVNLAKNDTQTLSVTTDPADATVTYASNNEAVATVSAGGEISAVGGGNTTITVTANRSGYNTATATCNVTVQVPVSGVTLNKNSTTITVDGSEQLTATVTPGDATDKSVTWSSDTPGVATVSNGQVTGVAPGAATITVTTVDGGYTTTCDVTVNPGTITISGVPANATLTVGGTTQTINATTTPNNASLSYASSNEAVATVSAGGLITAVAPGDANVTVTASKAGYNQATSTIAVHVNPGTITLSVNQTNVTLTTDSTHTIVPTVNPADAGVTYSSSDTNVATVGGGGVITAMAPGDANITVTASKNGYNDATKTVAVHVNLGTITISGVPADVTLNKNSTQTLSAITNPAGASLSFASSNTSAATVSAGGEISAVGGGSATITVTAAKAGYNTATATCNVTVQVPISGVTLDKTSTTITVDGNDQLTATVAPNDATDKRVTWSSDTPGVATVSNGQVTGIAPGTAIINATTVDGGYTAACNVTVNPGNITISGVPANATLTVGGTTQTINATTTPNDATVTYASSNEAVATVNAGGLITAVAPGDANVTVTASKAGYNNATTTVAVHVNPGTITLSVDHANITLTTDGTHTIVPTVSPVNAGVSYSSNDTNVATVNGDGVITAVAPGSANITVTAVKAGYNDATATVAVTVNLGAIMVSDIPANYSLNAGGTQAISATVSPAGASLSYTSSDPNVATVSNNGIITAIAPGSATITVAASKSGYTTGTATVLVTVADTTAPTWPAGCGLTATVAANKVTLEWLPASDNLGVTGYQIYQDNNLLTTVTGTVYCTVTVNTTGSHSFSVIAVDAGQNASGALTVSVIIADIEPPIWGKNSALTATVSAPGNVNLSWPAATDSAGVTGYRVYQDENLLTTPPITNTSYTVTGATYGTYTFTVQAGDASGNWSTAGLSTSIFIAQINNTVSGDVYSYTGQPISLPAIAPLNNGNVQLCTDIPAGTTITGPAMWNGEIQAPTVMQAETINSSLVTPDAGKVASVNTVIEVGLNNGTLEFDKAVRLLIPGQGNLDVGYIDGSGAFHKINTVVEATYADAVTAELAAKSVREGKQVVGGNDLAVWTMHFTKFVTYEQTNRHSSSSDGGGSATPQAVTSTTGTALVSPGVGGVISLGNEATVEIPADALTGTSAVEVKVQKLTTPPTVPTGFRMAGSAYELSVGGKSSYNFAKNVTIKLSFNSSALSADETPAIYYYDDVKDQWVNLGGTVSGNTVTVQVVHFTKFAVLAVKKEEQKVEALNDIAGHWAEASIKKLVALGCISGYPDGSFKPDNNITRAEFATILVKAFKLDNKGGKIFADTAAHWAKDYIAAAAANGVVNGYDAGAFGPDDLITREQMAVMVVKAAKLATESSQGTSFKDSSAISPWAAGAVAVAARNGVIKGYPDDIFLPQGRATRAEAVTVIVNVLK